MWPRPKSVGQENLFCFKEKESEELLNTRPISPTFLASVFFVNAVDRNSYHIGTKVLNFALTILYLNPAVAGFGLSLCLTAAQQGDGVARPGAGGGASATQTLGLFFGEELEPMLGNSPQSPL